MNCPECGKEKDLGTIQIDCNNYWAIGHGVRWFKPNEEMNDMGTGGELLPWALWTRRNGVMCRECELILLRWTGIAKSKKSGKK